MKTHKKKVLIKREKLSNLIAFPSPSHKGAFTRFTKVLELTTIQNQELAELFMQVEQNDLNEEKVVAFLTEWEENIKKVTQLLPHAIKRKVNTLPKIQSHLSLKDKFKTSLPIIPYILMLDTEGVDKTPFEEMWMNVHDGVYFNIVATRGLEDNSTLRKYKQSFLGISIFEIGDGAIQFTSYAAICVDGAPTAYGPNDSGQDFTSSAGHNKGDVKTYKKDANGNKIPDTYYQETNWWAVETDNDTSSGKPIVTPEGFYISQSSYNYSGFPQGLRTHLRYVNADAVPYSVLYAGLITAFGLQRGDLVYVKNKYKGKNIGKWTSMLETRSSADRLGEISTLAADALNIPSSPRHGGQDGDVEYTFYKNTAPNYRFKNDKEAAYYIYWNGKRIDEGKPVDRDLRLPS